VAPYVQIEGIAEVGTKLTVRMGAGGGRGKAFKPTVLAATPGVELRWLGRLGFGGVVDGEHFLLLDRNADGTTQLTHGERYAARSSPSQSHWRACCLRSSSARSVMAPTDEFAAID
jgi:hypothetical protein